MSLLYCSSAYTGTVTAEALSRPGHGFWVTETDPEECEQLVVT